MRRYWDLINKLYLSYGCSLSFRLSRRTPHPQRNSSLTAPSWDQTYCYVLARELYLSGLTLWRLVEWDVEQRAVNCESSKWKCRGSIASYSTRLDTPAIPILFTTNPPIMPTPIELSLTSLLPTVSPLPDELVNLAASLLAQSRTKATTLKPEEEIGRTYACSHIACQRLGHWLALDIAKPTPPVNPKVYSKLHTYLNSVLRTQTTPRRRAAGTAQARDTPSSARVNAQLKDVKAAANERVASNAAPATVELSK